MAAGLPNEGINMKYSLMSRAVLTLAVFLAGAAAEARPRQAWATKDQVIDLAPNGTRLAVNDPAGREAIRDAFARWGIAYDESRMGVIRSLFTPAAVFDVTLASKQPIAHAEGIDAIIANVTSALAQQNDQRRHAISNVVIDRMTRTDATAIAYGVVTIANDGLSLGATVIYSANLHKGNDGVWRFSRLVIGMDGYAGPAIVNPK
jgi:hypothetical protein